MRHSHDGSVELLLALSIRSFGDERVQGYRDRFRAFRRVAFVRGELLLHERLHEFRPHE